MAEGFKDNYNKVPMNRLDKTTNLGHRITTPFQIVGSCLFTLCMASATLAESGAEEPGLSLSQVPLDHSNLPVMTLTVLLVLAVGIILFLGRKLIHRHVSSAQTTTATHLLQQSVEQFLSAQNIVHIGTWSWDIPSQRMFWSKETFIIFSLDPTQHEASVDKLLDSIHHSDRLHMNSVIDEVLCGGENEYTWEVRLLDVDEARRYAKIHCRMTLDNEGKPLTLSGVIHDTTEQKLIELELREKQRTLQSLLDNAPIGIWFQNTNGKLLFVNRAFCYASGISEKEFLSAEHYSMLYPPESAKSCMASDEIALSNEGPQISHERMRFMDNKFHDLEIIKSRVRDEQGLPLGLIGLSMDITDKKLAEKRLRHQAYFDELTSLGNRNYLMENLARSLASASRHSHYNALLFFDLDNFKIINDSLGHQAGDMLLKEIGQRLRKAVRTEDSVARLGGDEFIVILNNLGKEQSLADALSHDIAENIRQKLACPYELYGQEQHVTMSVGISMFPSHDNDIYDILKHADTAMYRAKEAGRNTVRFFMPSMQKDAEERLLLLNMLRYALPNKQFTLHFQPQYDHTGMLVGAESLLRWQHPTQGFIPPSRFIPVAEESGQIIDIGTWVIQETCKTLKHWHDLGKQNITLSANVSPRQFHQPTFVEQVLSIVTETHVNPHFLELELTESILIEHLGDVTEKMNALKKHGIRFAIDDFGTGYSSLAYLKRLPLDRLKIDQSFVCDVTTDPSDARIVEAIIAMSTHLQLEVVAEGVETEEQLDFLCQRGCIVHQGFFFSHPLDGKTFENYLRQGDNHYHSIQ